ncbi:glycosyltransferase family 2 protein [Acinetobacter sp. SwsAc6]|uniref:glycosyltransferase family 2 protein n=1 Tax=Acinetobacter sp. SwsAc6 TaxID=2749439 RepID=UPI0015BA2FEF|nr:glycosyltransferase family A protein [Acinetobacter sp. SwsAc6]NWK72819.1 glycosyltransferase family 2 protein [Acinetobacter sp. SwsAc6]
MTIKVSIIIPSAGRRSDLLKRAIKSAILDDAIIKTEIIVVLNGKDGMLFNLENAFQHPLVTYHKVEDGGVSKARNYGISKSKGQFIRFLDDDDFLYPDIAYQQYLEMLKSDADLSTYGGAVEDQSVRYQIVLPIHYKDFCAAVLSANCPALTFATVYKTSLIKTLKWPEMISIAEDESWMRLIAESCEVNWITNKNVVGVWYQHNVDRLSYAYAHPQFGKNRFSSIYRCLENLSLNNRLTIDRKKSAVEGIWSSIHSSFFFAPFYWTSKSFVARNLNKTVQPIHLRKYEIPYWFNPIIIEWILLPKRLANHIFRVLRFKLKIGLFIRKG